MFISVFRSTVLAQYVQKYWLHAMLTFYVIYRTKVPFLLSHIRYPSTKYIDDIFFAHGERFLLTFQQLANNCHKSIQFLIIPKPLKQQLLLMYVLKTRVYLHVLYYSFLKISNASRFIRMDLLKHNCKNSNTTIPFVTHCHPLVYTFINTLNDDDSLSEITKSPPLLVLRSLPTSGLF